MFAELSFFQEIVLAMLNAIVGPGILLAGGALLVSLYEVRKKRREQEIELARFVRERQYEAIAELYAFFAEFMRLYRMVNAGDTDLRDAATRQRLFGEAVAVETKVDALILRIASEFTHNKRAELQRHLADLRQSVQLWRERIAESKRLPFSTSDQADYVRFKNAFAHVATHIANEVYRSLDAPTLSPDAARELLAEVFDNKHER